MEYHRSRCVFRASLWGEDRNTEWRFPHIPLSLVVGIDKSDPIQITACYMCPFTIYTWITSQTIHLSIGASRKWIPTTKEAL